MRRAEEAEDGGWEDKGWKKAGREVSCKGRTHRIHSSGSSEVRGCARG